MLGFASFPFILLGTLYNLVSRSPFSPCITFLVSSFYLVPPYFFLLLGTSLVFDSSKTLILFILSPILCHLCVITGMTTRPKAVKLTTEKVDGKGGDSDGDNGEARVMGNMIISRAYSPNCEIHSRAT